MPMLTIQVQGFCFTLKAQTWLVNVMYLPFSSGGFGHCHCCSACNLSVIVSKLGLVCPIVVVPVVADSHNVSVYDQMLG